jgi:hypothetical protein
MPPRPSHIPHNAERTVLQKLRGTTSLPFAKLQPAGPKTIAGMVAKGWLDTHLDARAVARFSITVAGEAALKAKIPGG